MAVEVVNFKNLPVELIEKIIKMLCNSNKDLLALSSTSKILNTIIKNYTKLWKDKCLKEYSTEGTNVKNYKKLYKTLYKTLCVCCYSKTSIMNYFYKNDRVCRNCEYYVPKYTCISKTACINIYSLNYEDFSHLDYRQVKNKYRSSMPISLYLESQIYEISKSPEVQERLEKKRKKKLMNKLFKFQN
jgi:hypothetical protein